MRVFSAVKIALLAGAVALPASFSVAEAKTKPLPPGACAFGKKGVVNAGTTCSYNCDPKTMWCMQQVCINGAFVAVLPCYTGFCTPKCGG